mmetsp:Transcript_28317/g.93793  ORF Transcript_28317/g.93793 Transcript_28317/m.93793 type:complete len:308 (-) Transcript_28317:28-951(-)
MRRHRGHEVRPRGLAVADGRAPPAPGRGDARGDEAHAGDVHPRPRGAPRRDHPRGLRLDARARRPGLRGDVRGPRRRRHHRGGGPVPERGRLRDDLLPRAVRGRVLHARLPRAARRRARRRGQVLPRGRVHVPAGRRAAARVVVVRHRREDADGPQDAPVPRDRRAGRGLRGRLPRRRLRLPHRQRRPRVPRPAPRARRRRQELGRRGAASGGREPPGAGEDSPQRGLSRRLRGRVRRARPREPARAQRGALDDDHDGGAQGARGRGAPRRRGEAPALLVRAGRVLGVDARGLVGGEGPGRVVAWLL